MTTVEARRAADSDLITALVQDHRRGGGFIAGPLRVSEKMTQVKGMVLVEGINDGQIHLSS